MKVKDVKALIVKKRRCIVINEKGNPTSDYTGEETVLGIDIRPGFVRDDVEIMIMIDTTK